ncbi:MAG: hypothetical protein MZW92_07455 [Comamonadaceae bacterium]|nr:hypothetical protein [Comamonadaceae bacterium]
MLALTAAAVGRPRVRGGRGGRHAAASPLHRRRAVARPLRARAAPHAGRRLPLGRVGRRPRVGHSSTASWMPSAGPGWTAMAGAPIVEEALKAAILVRFYVARQGRVRRRGRRGDLRRDGRPRVRVRGERRLLRARASSREARPGSP